MKLDEVELLAYANGELPPHERDRVEKALRESPDAQAQLALLRASDLPYQEAFARAALPPVPESLAAAVGQMARDAARQDSRAQTGANDPAVPHASNGNAVAPVRSRLRVAPAWLAVAFVAGAFFCGGVLRLAPGILGGAGGAPSTAAQTWVGAAAGYQQLYSRETLEYVDSNADLTKKTLDQLRTRDGLALSIPDLSAQGLTFKRVQRLRFGDKALVQIVYLPQHGAPVALCVVKDARTDQPPAQRRIGNMNVVMWRRSQLGYALIGHPGDADLAALAKDLADRRVDALYGDASFSGVPLSAS
ncbi:anti-sigma factor [Paraburkholderia sp. J41]|uniref:anti-sigma factor family protein n=1 Tax=Paraburkholderia sp. J41 TaxID=2805433 RepID=UPI002AC316BD|nr:anti-sigma factor [Paraburkholderia sp. J41]